MTSVCIYLCLPTILYYENGTDMPTYHTKTPNGLPLTSTNSNMKTTSSPSPWHFRHIYLQGPGQLVVTREAPTNRIDACRLQGVTYELLIGHHQRVAPCNHQTRVVLSLQHPLQCPGRLAAHGGVETMQSRLNLLHTWACNLLYAYRACRVYVYRRGCMRLNYELNVWSSLGLRT